MYTPDTLGLVDLDFLQAIKEKYNVVDMFDLHGYELRLDLLEQKLKSIKKTTFDVQDRIIVVHFDTDYYLHNEFGLTLANLFTLWQRVDLPLYTLLLYTNHIGVGKEVDIICQDRHPKDRPTLIETFINPANYSDLTYSTEPELNVDTIEYHGLSMMGAPRSHRFALYNHLNYLADKLIFTVRAHL
jgi:hypothetical protein